VKFCIYVAACISLIFYGFTDTFNPRLERLGSGDYFFYSTETVSSPYITNTVDLGFSFIYRCRSEDAGKLRQNFTRIDGESIVLDGSISVRAVLQKLNYNIVSRSYIGAGETVYAFSGRGKDFIRNGTKKINLQIAFNGEKITVGWPVILGSY
jgi:hypothetical protein